MGKKKARNNTRKQAHTFPIKKEKSLKANLTAYMRLLKTKHSDLTAKQYLAHLHQYIARYSKIKRGLPHRMIVQTTSTIKICRQCKKWATGSQKMIQCQLCEDVLHRKCAGNLEFGDQQWFCNKCQQVNSRINRHLEARKERQSEKVSACDKCKKDKKQSFVACMRCDKTMHKSCFGTKVVVCSQCDLEIEESVTCKVKRRSTKQLNLRDSFKRLSESTKASKLVSKNGKKESREEQKIQQNEETIPKFVKNSEPDHNTMTSSNTRKFTSKFPDMTPEQIVKYKESLVYAILSKKMQYVESLQPQNCSLAESYEESLDFALENMSPFDFKAYLRYKQQPIGPFILEYQQKMGYNVIADKNLPKGMIVCQYVGDVYTHRQVVNLGEPNDSIMQLKKGTNADESLFIVPRKFTNIARFINGINEKCPQKANVASVRQYVAGQPVIILYTIRPVKKGQSLFYDYNAGAATKGIDTSDFI